MALPMITAIRHVVSLFWLIAGFSLSAAITGTVLERQDLIVGTAAPLTSASLTGGVVEQPLCTIAEQSNSGSGYTVTLESANAGSGNSFKLVGTTAGNEVSYQMSYGGSPVTLASGKAVITDSAKKNPKAGISRKLSITIPADQNPPSDTYSDVLTLTLSAK